MSSLVLTRPVSKAKATSTEPGSSISGLSVKSINGQPTLTLVDMSRNDKALSIAEQTYIFSRNRLLDGDWMRLGENSSAESAVVAELDGTLVFATGHCENAKLTRKEIKLYVNDNMVVTLGTIMGASNSTFFNSTLNVDFVRGDRIRVRVMDVAGSLAEKARDTVVKITIKHRA